MSTTDNNESGGRVTAPAEPIENEKECSEPSSLTYEDPKSGKRYCNCLICGRCGKHTGNTNQGHNWAWCSVTKSKREFHFCCPGDCELEVAAATQGVTIAEELRQAAKQLHAIPGCDFAEPLANWLEHTADNMADENAYEGTFDRADGSTYTQVVPAALCHVGLPYEWTAALETARRINQAEAPKREDRVDVEKTPLGLDDVGGYPVGRSAGQVRVSAERVQGILHGLNSFPDREYDNLTEAIDWAKSQPDVAAAYGPLLGEANLQLVDGTVIEWQSDRKCWDVAVSDECDTSEVAR